MDVDLWKRYYAEAEGCASRGASPGGAGSSVVSPMKLSSLKIELETSGYFVVVTGPWLIFLVCTQNSACWHILYF